MEGLGTGASARYLATKEITERKVRKVCRPRNAQKQPLRVSEFFGENVFDLKKIRERLPKEVADRLISTIETGKKLDSEIAHSVAQAVMDWAVEKGVTHFCHWFQPMTGSTAEKHDAFLSFDSNKKPIEQFSGSQLIQSEPDASSFPSGGTRTTFEARGYTAWDPSSPVFIMESTNGSTLCIPSAFVSYHGDALDKKTSLVRSVEALSKRACELLQLIGDSKVKRIVPTLGCEQEYFLIDRSYYSLRPDLVMTGRTLVGAPPPRGQQMEDHYFGSIPSRVQACMEELELELYKLGVPVKTRHNEVAPSQFETAPIFEEGNIASDHNHLVMEMLRKVSRKHGFQVLLHEKPFAALNGSGKHCNWSMSVAASGAEDGTNLLEPGKTPHQNLRFLLFLMATLKGVHDHAGLLRAGIASAGNDHRLGANEAPPAIISVFLGDLLNQILDRLEQGEKFDQNVDEAVLSLGVSRIPRIMKDNTDRNRTSPFAFTGNKFEFRAVGASFSVAFPVTLLNSAVADGLEKITIALREKLKSKQPLDAAILSVLKQCAKDTKKIRFEGNNYAAEWVKEADVRGLPNLKKTPEALNNLIDLKSIEMLTRLGIYSENEIRARYNVRLERYIKVLLIEAQTLKEMVDTQILPAAYLFRRDLAQTVSSVKSFGQATPELEALAQVGSLVTTLQNKRRVLENLIHETEKLKTEEEKAVRLSTEVSECMEQVRQQCDQLELAVGDSYWPLPKYREMLFNS